MMNSSVQTRGRIGAAVVVALASFIGGCKSSGEETPSSNPTAEAKTTSPTPEPNAEEPKALKPAPKARAVTAEIQRGIEKHIDTKSSADNGYFSLKFEDRTLRLKLVRVHIEYLASRFLR